MPAPGPALSESGGLELVNDGSGCEGGLTWRSLITPIGVATAICPSCGHPFDKMPQRKRACPQCGSVLFSRKRAFDGEKVLLTERQALEGEAQQALRSLAGQDANESKLNSIVTALHRDLGRSPTADEVVARHLRLIAAEHAAAADWGLSRNALFELSESLIRQGQVREALSLLLEVSLSDLNGARNCGGTRDPELLKRFPPFDAKMAFLAPGIVSRTREAIAILGLSEDQTRVAFEEVAGPARATLGLPRTNQSVWSELSKALFSESR